MKFVPLHSYILGRIVIRRPKSSIIRPDETKGISKFVIADAIGPGVTRVKVGDILVPNAVGGIVIDGLYRPLLEEKNVVALVTGSPYSEFQMQIEAGDKYVDFDSEDAAVSLGQGYGELEREPRASQETGILA